MKHLYQFILESVLSKELFSNSELVEIDKEEAKEYLDKNNGAEKLSVKNNNYESIAAFNTCKHYILKYNNYDLCIVGIQDVKEVAERGMSGGHTNPYMRSFRDINFMMAPLLKDLNSIDDKTKEMSKAIYVSYLLMFEDEKKKADISPIATIKVIFDKIKSFSKELNKSYIVAAGKDERITRLYCKLGGFKQYPEKDWERPNWPLTDQDKEMIKRVVIYSL